MEDRGLAVAAWRLLPRVAERGYFGLIRETASRAFRRRCLHCVDLLRPRRCGGIAQSRLGPVSNRPPRCEGYPVFPTLGLLAGGSQYRGRSPSLVPHTRGSVGVGLGRDEDCPNFPGSNPRTACLQRRGESPKLALCIFARARARRVTGESIRVDP